MEHRDILPAGTVLDGKYRIDRLIGAGGFGMTYEALDLGLNMRVAVKEYYPAHFGMREGTLTVRPRTANDADLFNRLKESFLREARTLAQLRHPCIVRVLSVFEGHGTAYMIMEYEAGKSLKSWLDGLGRLPTQSELDRIVMPLLDALEVLHGASFLHRDIAPDNIIVRADGTPVLLDFGAARRVMAELSGALTGIVKSGYSPQEQYANDPRAQGPWSDIYALGATLYRCVTGQTPSEATLRMLDDPLPPASTVAAGKFRSEFLAAIDRAMSLRPKDRPQSVADMRRLMQDATTVVDPIREPVDAGGSGSGWSKIDAPKPQASVPGRRWPRIAAAITGALVVAGGLWLTLPNTPPPVARDAEPRIEAERQRKAEEERRAGEAQVELQRQAEARRQREEAERQHLAEQQRIDQQRIEQEAARRRAEEELRRAVEERNAQSPRDVPKQGHIPQAGSSGSLANRLEEAFGPCPFCDDVKKLVSAEEYAELMGMAGLIERTYNEVKNRSGPREDTAARKVLEQLANVDLEPDPYAAIKAGAARCTIYAFGFLDNAAERVGQHQCMVRMVLIGGELTSLTIEKTSGDAFHANVKKFRVNAAAYLGRTSLKGHAITSYNRAQPKNRENPNFGNKVGLLVSLGGKPALISANQNGFTEADSTYFEVMVIGQ